MAEEAAARPVTVEEVAAAFDARFAGARRVVLAVSGGADSTALLHLALEWRSLRGAQRIGLSVATVDHGLRPGSDAEARMVAEAVGRLGLAHAVLLWRGDKPRTGVQAAARHARYRLLAQHALDLGAEVVATAHTRDDQAETVLMRLARGSGVDGLAGMRQEAPLIQGVRLVRPLLGLAKSRLLALLRERGIAWIEDPSNDGPAFERTRWRRARPMLDALGLAHEQLGRSARRLARAREALEAGAIDAVARAPEHAFRSDRLGFVELAWNWLLELPEEVRLRVLSRVIEAVGGGMIPPSLGQLEAMTVAAGWRMPAGRTLAGALLASPAPGRLLVVRELGRARAWPVLELEPGRVSEWDGRFKVALTAAESAGVRIAALGRGGLAQIEAAGVPRPAAPLRAVYALPGFWSGADVIAAPLLGFFAQGRVPAHFTCDLTRQAFAERRARRAAR